MLVLLPAFREREIFYCVCFLIDQIVEACVFIFPHMSPDYSLSLQIIGMSHRSQPCSEETYQSSAYAPETEQQEWDYQTCRCHRSRVRDKVAWISREEAYQEDDEVVDRACAHACQKAKPTEDGDLADHKSGDEADEETEYKREELQRCQNQRSLDGQAIHGNLQNCGMGRPRIDENDQDREQGKEHTCYGPSYQGRGKTPLR